MSTEEKPQRFSPLLRRLLILKVWLIEKFRFGERQVTLVWAAVIGILGAAQTHRSDSNFNLTKTIMNAQITKGTAGITSTPSDTTILR